MEFFMELLIDVAIFALVITVLVIVTGRITDRRYRRLREMAEALGLKFEARTMGVAEGGPPPAELQALAQRQGGSFLLRAFERLPLARSWRIDGQRQGVAVHISPDRQGKATKLTRLRADFALPIGLGQQSVQRAAPTPGAYPTAVATLLAWPEVQQQLQALFDAHAAARIDDHGVQVRLTGVVTDAARVGPLLDVMVQTARILQAARASL